MTSVRLNTKGIDIVELRLETTGSNFCHFTSKDNILNSDLEYIFGVTDLNADISNLPIFPPATDDVFLTIKKRHIGTALHALPNANEQLAPAFFGIFPNGTKYHDTTTFIAALSTFANTFSNVHDSAGINANHHGGGPNIPPDTFRDEGKTLLKIGITSSGKLRIEGLAEFWNHFVIVFSDYALKLFHLEKHVVQNSLSVTLINGVYTPEGLLVNGDVVAGGNLTNTAIFATNSILTFLDHRLYVTCETHLAIKNNLKVVNGKEQTDATIVRVPFLNEAVATIYSRHNEIVDDISLTTKCYSGRMSFVSKTGGIRQWNDLLTAYEQRIFRFQLFCIYNVFANGVFSQVKKDVPFEDDGSWDLSIRFVNKLL